MASYVDASGRTILTSIPTPPPAFINLTADEPGRYVFGHNFFPAADFPLLTIFHRKYAGNGEEFILALLSVILIAAISEIIHSIILQTRTQTRGHPSPTAMQTSFLIDETYHLRNVYLHLFSSPNRKQARSTNSTDGVPGTKTSILILMVALAILSIDMLAVYLTQPRIVHSRANEYSIRVSHPAGTSHALSDFIRRISLERTCVTPVVTNARQQRNYFLSACIRYDDINARTSANDAIQNLSITSFFHRGGGDHSFTFGTSEHSVKTRALVFPQPENTNPRRVLFRVLEDGQFSQTRYLHDVAVYAALEWACNRDVSTQTCAQLVETVRVVRRERVTRKVIYWEGREQTVAESVDGLRSEFHVRLEAPSRAVQAAGRVFATSAVVEEVAARGDFTDVTNERRVPGLAGMISEEGRVAGVPLLAMLAAIAVACVAILRALLRPISLAQAARLGLLSQRAEASDETMDGRGADAHVEIEAVLDDGFDERARDVR